MSDQPKLKISKVKILSVNDKSFKGKDDKQVKCWEIVLQNTEDTSQVITGLVYKVLDERIKQGEVVEDVWVYEDEKGDKVTTKFFFPKKGEGGSKPGGRSYGKSEAELKIMRRELIFKLYSTHQSYVKDILIATTNGIEAFPWEEWYKKSKEGAQRIISDLRELEG